MSHKKPSRGTCTERIKILIPEGDSEKQKVLFVMGYEAALNDRVLTALFGAYGEQSDMEIIDPEHSGYVKSIARDYHPVPNYICTAEALADYHAIHLNYVERFPGFWMIDRYNYNGGLLITYAHTYPDGGAVLLSSSGVA